MMKQPVISDCRRYLDWAKSPLGGLEQPQVLIQHLEGCTPCRSQQSQFDDQLATVGNWLDQDGSPPPPSTFAARTLAELETPTWQLRRWQNWAVPLVTLAALSSSALALMHPLPAGFARHALALEFLARPLATAGEVTRLLHAGLSTVISEASLTANPMAAVAGLAGIGLVWGARRLVLTTAPVRRS